MGNKYVLEAVKILHAKKTDELQDKMAKLQNQPNY